MVLKSQPKTSLEIVGNIFIITLVDNNEHLLNPDFLKSFRDDLDIVKKEARKGSVLITTADGEYFSNGLDFGYAKDGISNEVCKDRFLKMIKDFKELVTELISLPIPTIAAVNGYARSAGLVLALSHDYLTMKSGEDMLCFSELDKKMTLPDYFTALIRSKVGPGGWGRFAMRGLPFSSKDAKGFGLIVEPPAISSENPKETAVNLAAVLEKKQWDGQVYAEIRKALYPELCNVLGLSSAAILPSRL